MLRRMRMTLMMLFVMGGRWGVTAFSTGPPVDTNPEICESMTPYHGADASTDPSPFEVIFTGECYNASTTHQVTVQVIQASADDGVATDGIEGVFVQAKLADGSALGENYGTFTVDDAILSSLSCFNKNNSAVGQNQEVEAASRSMTWTPPEDSGMEDLAFYVTVVQHKETFWVGIKSEPLPACDASSLPMLSLSALTAVAFLAIIMFS